MGKVCFHCYYCFYTIAEVVVVIGLYLMCIWGVEVQPIGYNHLFRKRRKDNNWVNFLCEKGNYVYVKT